MTPTSSVIITINPRDYDAVLFDLDGVLTKTASVHAAAWKRLFDEFLQQRAAETGEPFVEFDLNEDYPRHVDGKPREAGVAAFLESRGIDLPHGSPADGPNARTICGLGNLKDEYFLEHLKAHGVERYDSSVRLVRVLRADGVKTAVVSSSRNCIAVLTAAGIADLFDIRVDGLETARLGIAGKPAPDVFLEAARRLGITPTRAVVVEDAVAGVEAGHRGGFGLVIGVDRVGQSLRLRKAGADVIVSDLSEIRVASEPPSVWMLLYDGFDPSREGIRESLCTLGNGYFATRGAAPSSSADSVHYPGTYLAGGYNRLQTVVDGRVLESEDLMNLPNWLVLKFRFDGGDWFDERNVTILEYRQELDLMRGMLLRTVTFEEGGRRTLLRERRLVSMHDMHLAALQVSLTPENWSGAVTIRTAIDGRVVNSGAQLYRRFNNVHLVPVKSEAFGDNAFCLTVRTSESNIHIVEAARTDAFFDGQPVRAQRQFFEEPAYVGQDITFDIGQGRTVTVEKVVSLYTSRDAAISDPERSARTALTRAGRFGDLMNAHVRMWEGAWRRFDVDFDPPQPLNVNSLMLLRLNMFHLLQTVSVHSIGLDVGIPARGWTGEAYQGHIFWDELFILSFFNQRIPEITRSVLFYRYRRLNEARAAAREAGYQGAMFPWQSGSDGQEVTQKENLNPRSERWVRDNSYLERHVGSAIAYNVWQYFQATHDLQFMEFCGAELMFEIARFWSSIAVFNEGRGRYEIHGVVGPDEFHEGYPGAPAPGVNNNAYTNVMAVWVLCRAIELLDLLPATRRVELTTDLGLTRDEVERWDDISRRMFIPFHDGVISQFEGYETLKELDWDRYRRQYGNIQRMDLILEAENDTPNAYKLSKQADVLMLFYLFSANELRDLFARLGYLLDRELIPRTVDYYDTRTSQGSTLGRVVHAWVFARSDRSRSLRYFLEAFQSDTTDIQQGTTKEGVHLGAMGGTVDMAQRVATGMEMSGDVLRFNPQLPEQINRLDMRIRYREHSLDLHLTHATLIIRSRDTGPPAIRVGINDAIYELAAGSTLSLSLSERSAA